MEHIWVVVVNLFKGRIGRLNFLLGLVLIFLFTIIYDWIFGNSRVPRDPFELLIVIVVFVLIYSLMIRRLHDFNQSGWWVLISLIPIINILFFLFLLFKKGTEDSNKYGPPVISKKSILQQLLNT